MSDVKKFYKAEEETETSRQQLMYLADAFLATGNFQVAKKLSKIVGDLDRAVGEMRAVFNSQIDTAFKAAQQSSANMLNGVLAGLELGRTEKDAKL